MRVMEYVMNRNFTILLVVVLFASILPEVILKEVFKLNIYSIYFLKVVLMSLFCLTCLGFKNLRHLFKASLTLNVIMITQIIIVLILQSSFWKSAINYNIFFQNIGSSVLLKFIFTLPVLLVSIFIYKSKEKLFLKIGNLDQKVSKISLLGIENEMISWRKLTFISAFMISIVTFGLTIFTNIGITGNLRFYSLLKNLHFIILFALFNSFCEGIIFRNVILGSIKDILKKEQLLLLVALFFGIAHYYGAPGGVTGVIMSSILGWFLCLSMYETKGFFSSWFIHFWQDFVIFSALVLFINFS